MGGGKNENNSKVPPDWLFDRHKQLMDEGYEGFVALGMSSIEYILKRWPEEWGEYFHFRIFGDFEPPSKDTIYEELGITVYSKNLIEDSLSIAHCILDAKIKLSEISSDGIIEATRNINILLGGWTYLTGGSTGCGWTTNLALYPGNATYGSGPFDELDINTFTIRVLKLPPKVRSKVESAFFWAREPRKLSGDWFKLDTLRMFSSYWNAFECLVDAINYQNPRKKLSKDEKRKQLRQLLAKGADKITIEMVQEFCQTVIDPGLKDKAVHALQICYKNEHERFVDECFFTSERHDRLYEIRNAINHGEVDAENMMEVLRIRSRFKILWHIVWSMFGYLLGYKVGIEAGPSI